MKKTMVSVITVLSWFFLLSCQTTEVAKDQPLSPTFSVYSGKSDPLMCNVQGEMQGCRADWTVTAGILTHRQDCNSVNRKFMPLMLNAMARNLNETCALKIKYARVTTKDDEQAEKRLAKMMSQSKLWNKYSKASKANPKDKSTKEFPEKFIRKVVEVKGLFSDVAQALNTNGYNFLVEKVEVTKLNPLVESRHFQSLRQIKTANSFIVPENIRIVWLNKDFVDGKPNRMRTPQDTNTTQGLQKTLPQR